MKTGFKKKKKKAKASFINQYWNTGPGCSSLFQRMTICCTSNRYVLDSEERNNLQGCFAWITLEQRRVIVANEGRAPRTGLGYTNRECLKMGGDHLKSLLLLWWYWTGPAPKWISAVFQRKGKWHSCFCLFLNRGTQRLVPSVVLFLITSVGCTWSSWNSCYQYVT